MQNRSRLSGAWSEVNLFSKVTQMKLELPTLAFIPRWSFSDTWLLSATVAFLLLWAVLRLQKVACLHRQHQAHEEKVFLLLLQLVFHLIISLQDGTVKEATSSWPISSKPAFYFTTLVLRDTLSYICLFLDTTHLFEFSMSKVV